MSRKANPDAGDPMGSVAIGPDGPVRGRNDASQRNDSSVAQSVNVIVEGQRDRYREALVEIAKETGTPYARIAQQALDEIGERRVRFDVTPEWLIERDARERRSKASPDDTSEVFRG